MQGSFEISDSSVEIFDSCAVGVNGRVEGLNPPNRFVCEICMLALLSLAEQNDQLDLESTNKTETHIRLLVRGALLLSLCNQVLNIFVIHRLSW